MAQSGQPPLVGIKVLDLSRIIAGPLCCQQMADMGADILKVENPKTGDDSRNATKPWAGKDSHFFQAFNRNKRSIGLDFREGEGKKIFFKLLEEADVLVENFIEDFITGIMMMMFLLLKLLLNYFILRS